MKLICASERLRNIYIFRSQNTSAYIQSMQFSLFLVVWRYKRQYTNKILTLRGKNSMHMRASELRHFFAFSHSKIAISFNILLVLQILSLRNNTFSGLKLCMHIHIQSMPFPFISYGMALYINECTNKTQTFRKYMCMRASELRKCSHFHILKLPFLSIFCWYFSYLIGTNDMLVGLHVPTNFQMYRQNSEKALWGGGNCPPPPPLWLLR